MRALFVTLCFKWRHVEGGASQLSANCLWGKRRSEVAARNDRDLRIRGPRTVRIDLKKGRKAKKDEHGA